ncbi:hypothetical protein HQ865_13675 [Mucilaginibacter mali]|uniref:Uncharacterized protein n=1 Tax=Mucilaginibacter mali TaxID=2740462 RepID=A0A7D4UFS1_9SPHI|nr:hypothetical protein [Mucilaginibacter mali]QKJ30756.1 hypothetical protein HQ865_13675 [Mucilaginibacter mali]
MKKIRIPLAFITVCTLITLAISTLSFTTWFGLDTYEIYLNNQSVFRQAINQPVNLRVLQLDKAAATDQLQVLYRHCRKDNGPGTGRSIALKDETGSTLRKWDFADPTGTNPKMTIAMRDLLQIAGKNTGHRLSLYYTAHELEKEEMLSMLRFK